MILSLSFASVINYPNRFVDAKIDLSTPKLAKQKQFMYNLDNVDRDIRGATINLGRFSRRTNGMKN